MKDIDIAVASARKAFNTTWGKNVTGFERSKLLNKLADLMERDQEVLAEVESLNNGKPMKIARYENVFSSLFLLNVCRSSFIRDFDIGDSIQCLRYYAGWADKITGQVYRAPLRNISCYSCFLFLRLSKSTTKPSLLSLGMILLEFADKCT